MSKQEILEGLKSGRKLRFMLFMLLRDRRDEPLLPWLLSHPNIANSGIVQLDDQSSYMNSNLAGERTPTMTSTSRTNRIAQLLTLMALLLGVTTAAIRLLVESVPSDNIETCTRRLADFHDNSLLSPVCQGVAKVYSYLYIEGAS